MKSREKNFSCDERERAREWELLEREKERREFLGGICEEREREKIGIGINGVSLDG